MGGGGVACRGACLWRIEGGRRYSDSLVEARYPDMKMVEMYDTTKLRTNQDMLS